MEQANFVDPDSSSLDRRLQGNSLQQFPSAAEASQRDTTAPTQRQLAAEQAERSGQKLAPSPPRRSPSPTLKTISGVGIRRRSRSPKPASESLRVRSTSGGNSKVRSHDDAGLSPERTKEVDRLRDQFMHWFDGCLRPDSGLSPQCLWDAFARSDHHRHPQRRANAWPASSLMRCLKGRQGCCPPPCCESAFVAFVFLSTAPVALCRVARGMEGGIKFCICLLWDWGQDTVSRLARGCPDCAGLAAWLSALGAHGPFLHVCSGENS